MLRIAYINTEKPKKVNKKQQFHDDCMALWEELKIKDKIKAKQLIKNYNPKKSA